MEQVLELYQQPYEPKHPMVCMDEQPKQLIEKIMLPMLARWPKAIMSMSATACATYGCLPSRWWAGTRSR